MNDVENRKGVWYATRDGRAACQRCGMSVPVKAGDAMVCQKCKSAKMLVWMDTPDARARWGDPPATRGY